jgi:hypothetical protein
MSSLSSTIQVRSRRKANPPTSRRIFQVLWILVSLGWLCVLAIQALDGLQGIFISVCILGLWLAGYLGSRKVVEKQRKLEEINEIPLPPPSINQWVMLGFIYLILAVEFIIAFSG